MKRQPSVVLECRPRRRPIHWMRFALRLGCCLLAVLGAVVSYIKVSALWLPYDGFSRHLLLSELPLLAALVGLWVPVGTARGWLGLAWSGATALCLIGALYVGHDVFYVALNRLPGVADLSNIRVLGEFGGWPLVAVTTVLLLATGTWTGLLIVEAVASQRSARYLGCMGLRLLLGMALLWSLPWYAMQVFQDYAWSELRSIETNGRLVAFVHRAVVQTDNVQRLRAEAGRIQTIPSPFVAGRLSAAAPRTIHLVVLESFGDPRRIGWLRYEPAPLAPELTAILGGDIAHWTAVSPVFGGGTAQAEFELLSGGPGVAALPRLRVQRHAGVCDRRMGGGPEALGLSGGGHHRHKRLLLQQCSGLPLVGSGGVGISRQGIGTPGCSPKAGPRRGLAGPGDGAYTPVPVQIDTAGRDSQLCARIRGASALQPEYRPVSGPHIGASGGRVQGNCSGMESGHRQPIPSPHPSAGAIHPAGAAG